MESIEVISPTGSGNSETTFKPEIIESILESLSSSLSIKADPISFSFAAFKSLSFSSKISFLFASISKAIFLSASFFLPSEAWDNTLEATLASCPS